MKQPTKLMKRALRQSKEWNKSWLEKTEKEGMVWINMTGSVKTGLHPDVTSRMRIIVRAEDVTIGESVSWHLGSDKDGNAVAIYEEDEETVKKFYESHART